jgi:hypothetical protein
LQRAVETHLIAETAAQEIAHRGFENAPAEIPQSDFDAAGGGDRDARDGARPGALHQHLGVKLIDVERIFAHDNGGQFVEDQVFHAPTPVSFTDAVKAGIGLDLDEIPVPCAADDHAFNAGDLHLLS